MASSADKLNSWLMPTLLTAALAVLGWMALTLTSISESLAVVVYKVENHEKRIDTLEIQRIRSRP